MADFAFGGGTSNLEITRTSKGDYTWSIKLYFIGNDMRAIKHVLGNMMKTRTMIESMLGQAVTPTDEQTAYEKSLREEIKNAQANKDAEAKKKVKAKLEPQPPPEKEQAKDAETEGAGPAGDAQ